MDICSAEQLSYPGPVLTITMRYRPRSSEPLAKRVRPALQLTTPRSEISGSPYRRMPSARIAWTLSRSSVSDRSRANPNDLLKTLIFADFEDDLLGVTELVRGKPVTKVGKPGNILVPRRERWPRNLIDRSPRKSKRSRLVECTGRKIQQAGTCDYRQQHLLAHFPNVLICREYYPPENPPVIGLRTSAFDNIQFDPSPRVTGWSITACDN